MKKLIAACALALSLISTQGFAASGCYTAREVEAEQGLRIHSELMVIGLTCLKMPGGEGLYAKYGQFTNQNQDLIAGYESDMISYYRGLGASNPEKMLHSLRTNLANKISEHTITMGTLSFCQHFSPRIDKALSMDHAHLRRWAQHIWPDTPVSQQLCTAR